MSRFLLASITGRELHSSAHAQGAWLLKVAQLTHVVFLTHVYDDTQAFPVCRSMSRRHMHYGQEFGVCNAKVIDFANCTLRRCKWYHNRLITILKTILEGRISVMVAVVHDFV